MNRLRRPLCMALAASMLVVFSPSAIAHSQLHTLTFTTGSFFQTCTSSGQLCSPAETLSFRLRHRGTLTSITYTTAAAHCSSVRLHVLLKGHQIAQTAALPAGRATQRLTTHVALRKGRTTLGFKAQGFVGGCNTGQLLSWGGDVTVTVTTR